MLGQPVSMLIPRVVGFKLSGELPEGSTATDLVLTITEMLRQHGVVGKFVEFYGDGVVALPVANRATIGNMSPEFGSTIAVFPIDEQTIEYLRLTGRPDEQLALVEAYAKEQGLWHDPERRAALQRAARARPLDRRTVAGRPKRPQDRVEVTEAKDVLPRSAGRLRRRARQQDEQGYDEAVAESFPASDSPSHANGNGAAEHGRRRPRKDGGRPSNPVTVTHRRPGGRDRPRRRRDRRDHVVHQHLQPERDDRRRPAGQERRREGAAAQAVGQDLAGARAPRWSATTTRRPASRRTSTSSASTSSATAARPASATPARSSPR